MTPEFAATYRATAASLRPDLPGAAARDRRRRSSRRPWCAATDQQVQALVFLDSFVSEQGGEPVRLPYRTLVTMTKTGHGWLVSNIETR